MRRILIVLWVGLLGLIGFQWWGWPAKHQQAIQVEPDNLQSQGHPEEQAVPPLLAFSQEAYQEISDRTLFRRDRTGYYPDPEAASAPPVDEKLPKFQLLGVILADQEPPAALILEQQQKKSRRIHVGEKIGEWELVEISDIGIELRLNDNRTTVFLRPNER